MRPLSRDQAYVLVRLVDSNIIRASDGSWIWVLHLLAFAPATTIIINSLVDRGLCSIRGPALRETVCITPKGRRYAQEGGGSVAHEMANCRRRL
jgi:hypothetical protein